MSTVIWCGFVSKWSMAPNFGPFSCRTWRDSIIFIFSFLGSKFLRRMDMGMDQDARFSVWMRGWTSTTTSCFGDWCRSFDPCWYAARIYYNYILVSRLCLPWLNGQQICYSSGFLRMAKVRTTVLQKAGAHVWLHRHCKGRGRAFVHGRTKRHFLLGTVSMNMFLKLEVVHIIKVCFMGKTT